MFHNCHMSGNKTKYFVLRQFDEVCFENNEETAKRLKALDKFELDTAHAQTLAFLELLAELEI